jgi:hypothetical protein
LKVWVWEAPSLLPGVDLLLRPRREGYRRLFRTLLCLGFRAYVVHVIASYLMLGTIATSVMSAITWLLVWTCDRPLRKCFIATNVPPLAGFATLAAFGVAPS